jgi:hypothetical protein
MACMKSPDSHIAYKDKVAIGRNGKDAVPYYLARTAYRRRLVGTATRSSVLVLGSTAAPARESNGHIFAWGRERPGALRWACGVGNPTKAMAITLERAGGSS